MVNLVDIQMFGHMEFYYGRVRKKICLIKKYFKNIFRFLVWTGQEPYQNIRTKDCVARVISDPNFHPPIAPSIPSVLKKIMNQVCFSTWKLFEFND